LRLALRLFAAAAEALGTREVWLELPDGATARDCLEALAARGGPLLRRCRLAVDRAAVPPDFRLTEGAEVAVLPPVSGGGALSVGPEPVSPEALLAAVAGPDAGGNVLFLGTVRGRTGQQRTARLQYEAYPQMAERVLADVAAEASRLWPGVRVAMAHRIGPLAPGEAAVGVAAAASHRGDAFAAARFCIERLKAELPVWKKEERPDGSAFWVDHA
jgi:molybdopterin synthase catalytic subunit/molybdopterin converting factor small subunit